MQLRFTKEELIEALSKKKQACKRADAEEKRNRANEKKEALKKVKERLKDASKWSYEDWEKNGWSTGLSYGETPSKSCMKSRESELDIVIEEVKLTNQKNFVISAYGTRSGIYSLLMVGAPKQKTICD